MDDKGWIPREQIRGLQSESRVPEAFLIQNSDIANPPTLLFSISKLAESIKYTLKENLKDDETGKFLLEIYPKLKK